MSTAALIQEVLSWVLVVSGAFFALVGAFGTWRLPDFWSRLHAASVTDSAGMILLIAGMCLQSGLTLVTVKLIVIGIFLFITGPTATHAVANAALVSGLRPREAEGLIAAEPEPLTVAGGAEGDAEGTRKETAGAA
ncbi:monovalent cation/H(+) antiporter subunit G [Marimonas arenosa]|uniref:Monovalent cation/H(+) antiporter subunit G n=1 Tax=Marimonas arenosa TaxID=1795305 RepID=A0AAE4B7A9_9RHOB|nr:monovalent cation/H(+) antiporter subunit G [Marimonas arenosa]MDQ2092164.1 monovalent cation/H(+) antiporter subunit G [Marimonas arenosa]